VSLSFSTSGELVPSLYQASLLQELVQAKCEFIVVGAVAMRTCGYERETTDIDLWLKRSTENATRAIPIFVNRFRNKPSGLTKEWFCSDGKRMPLPSDVDKEFDILTSIGALDFDMALKNSRTMKIGTVSVQALGRNEQLYSKLLSASSDVPQQVKERDARDFVELLSRDN